MRLIDADALADASCHGGVCAECDDMYGGNNVVTNCSEVRLRFLKLIKDAPTIEERKRINGHWVEIGDEPYDEWECDVCGFVIDGSGCIDPEEYKDVYKFCPNCGADMRGEQDE